VVVKSEIASSQPWVLGELFAAFRASKERYLDRLGSGGPSCADDERNLKLKGIVGGDPLPYGMAANRKAIEMLAKYCFEQKMLPKLYTTEELFDPSVMDWK
jgi:4,5-dihydroxyphthalate decarboxylase